MHVKNITTVNELRSCWQEVRQDTRRGASELLRQALDGLAEWLSQVEPESDEKLDLNSLCRELENLRRDMVGFRNSARLLDKSGIVPLRNSLRDLRGYLDRVPEEIAELAGESIPGEKLTVMTVSRSSGVENILCYLNERGRLHQVLQLESRPAFEGRDNAEKLLAAGIRVTILPDAAMGCWIEQADIILVGADAVGTNGDFIGKIGCLPLACMAERRELPFYVVAESLKVTNSTPSLETVNQRFTGEPLAWGLKAEGLTLSKVIFERVPADLVTGYLTESGLQYPPLA